MIYTENTLNILVAKTYKGIGRAWIVKNLKGNEDVETIVSLLNRDAKEASPITISDFQNNKAIIQERVEKLRDVADGIVAFGDYNFPLCRGNVKSSEQPIFLIYRGDLNLLKKSNKNIAVIGLLNPDTETEVIEKQVVSKFVENGVTIISGLALGCDTIAHVQALDSNGKTVAILPGPLSNIMPAANKDLANKIVIGSGLLITEYFDNANSKIELNSRYQERDRLQALFSDCIILSASYAKNNDGNDSGSRLAMGYALNYSIPRAVIYDEMINFSNQKYDLNRQLIKEHKDIMVINKVNMSDIVEHILSKKSQIKSGLSNQTNLFG